MLFSLAREASQEVPGERRKMTIFAALDVQDWPVREIRLSSRSRFWKVKAGVCALAGLRADDVCLIFEGRELLADQRPCDVEMYDGAVVSVAARARAGARARARRISKAAPCLSA